MDAMKKAALSHPKTHDLADRLEVTRPTVLGHLELLFDFTAEHAPQGNIGKWTNGSIARMRGDSMSDVLRIDQAATFFRIYN